MNKNTNPKSVYQPALYGPVWQPYGMCKIELCLYGTYRLARGFGKRAIKIFTPTGVEGLRRDDLVNAAVIATKRNWKTVGVVIAGKQNNEVMVRRMGQGRCYQTSKSGFIHIRFLE